MPPDGGGKGHFTTLAEMATAIVDLQQRVKFLETDVHALTDSVFGKKRPRRRGRIRPKAGE